MSPLEVKNNAYGPLEPPAFLNQLVLRHFLLNQLTQIVFELHTHMIDTSIELTARHIHKNAQGNAEAAKVASNKRFHRQQEQLRIRRV